MDKIIKVKTPTPWYMRYAFSFASVLTALMLAGCGGGGGSANGANNGSTPNPTPGIVVDNTPRFAYVIDKSVIGSYVVDPDSGNLIPRGNSQQFFETTPVDLATSPNGHFLYFSDTGGSPAIKRYDIEARTGTLTFASDASDSFTVASPGAGQILIHPSGKFLFYRMNGTGLQPITALALDTTSGDMRLIGNTAPLRTSSLHLAPDGNFLYSAYSSGGLEQDIQAFAVASDGNLQAVDADPGTSGTQRQSFIDSSRPTFHPTNGDVYMVTDILGSGSINRYRRATNGLLEFVDNTPLSNATPTTYGTWQDGLMVEPQGRYGYLRLGSNQIAAFSIDAVNGTLTPIDYDTATTGIQHFDFGSSESSIRTIRFEPSGHFVYVGFVGTSGTMDKIAIDQSTGRLSRATSKTELNRILALNGPVDAIVFTNRTGVEAPAPLYAYSRGSGVIGIHRIDPATGKLTVIGSFAIPAYSHLQVGPAQGYLYVSENAANAITRVRIDAATGLLSNREVRSNAGSSTIQAPRFDPHNRYAVQTRALSDGMDFMQVVTGPPGGLGAPASAVQFGKDPYSATNYGGASAVRPNSRQIYATGLLATSPIDWKLRLFNLVSLPVTFDRVDAQPGTSGHQDFSISSRAEDTVVEPLGRYLLTLETTPLTGGATNTDNLAVYELDWKTGVPTIRLALTVPFVQRNHTTGSNPLQIVLDPRGRFVYVPTKDGIAGFEFTRNPIGPALAPIDIDPVTPGFNGLLHPASGYSRLAIDPTGQWLYSNTDGYRIDPDSGALVSIGTASSASVARVVSRL